jgi:hypothetical protein
MDIIIKIEDNQIAELVNKTSEEIGTEYFAEAMKQGFAKYIDKELEAAFGCIHKTYVSDRDRNADKDNQIAESFIRNLFVKANKNTYNHTTTYEPTEYMNTVIRNIPMQETLDKYRDDLIASLHENIDKYIAIFIRDMFIGNIFDNRTFRTALATEMDMAIIRHTDYSKK